MPDQPIRTAREAMVSVRYTNWKGVTSLRNIIPVSVAYEATDWHPERQWILHAYDVDKAQMRGFALKDCCFTHEESLDGL